MISLFLRDLWLPFLEHLFKTEIEVFHQLWGNWFRDGRILLSESHPVSLENKKSVPHDVKVRYAYYASDNPLETGSTLAADWEPGVKPTYLITIKILEQILTKINTLFTSLQQT
jgi:hypothetical protein